MLREQGELEEEHKAALLELQEKNERWGGLNVNFWFPVINWRICFKVTFFLYSLLYRVHEVLKQCQDLKTDNSQKERKIDELTEENGTLSAQVKCCFLVLKSCLKWSDHFYLSLVPSGAKRLRSAGKSWGGSCQTHAGPRIGTDWVEEQKRVSGEGIKWGRYTQGR